jgi:ferredoxin-thioredoxin reductase catalytic subunit
MKKIKRAIREFNKDQAKKTMTKLNIERELLLNTMIY